MIIIRKHITKKKRLSSCGNFPGTLLSLELSDNFFFSVYTYKLFFLNFTLNLSHTRTIFIDGI